MENAMMWKKPGEIIFQFVTVGAYLLFAFLCLYPFYYLLLVSVSSPDAVAKGAVLFFPRDFTLIYYDRILRMDGIFNAFFVSCARTIIGTILTVFFSSILAYVVTKKEMVARRFFYRATVFTMYVNAGLIPWFIALRAYGLKDSFLLYVLPAAVSPFAVVLIKTYIESISPSIEESAFVDGAGFFTIFRTIIVPLSKPVIAAVAVFSAVYQWNQWQDNFFLVNKASLQTMQYTLMLFLRQAETLALAMAQNSKDPLLLEQLKRNPLNPFTVRTAITMVTIVPILVVYPILQRYFVTGIMLGAVKG